MVFKGVHFIGGRWSQGKGETFRSINPADGSELWSGKAATQREVDTAMIAARAAFLDWADLSLESRLKFVRAYHARLAERRSELAEIVSQETGKPLWEAEGEVGTMLAKVDISIAAYHDRTGTRLVSTQPETIVAHRPHGVLGILGPYNFPAHLANGHYLPALIAGNVVVLKPSEYTPMVGLFLAQLWDEVGVP
ncbi:aldehyde dehydrogenase family protein, partial [bacterium]|nr:aldehyde dehydrogenase family protein [bacterium]